MLWIIQSDFPRAEQIDAVVDVLERHAIPFVMVAALEKGWEKLADASAGDRTDVAVYGTTALTRHAAGRWQPGCFSNENFTFDACLAGWGDEMLNSGGELLPLKDVAFEGPMFIRPHRDGKLFDGEIVDGRRFPFWREMRLSERKRLSPDDLVVIAPLRRIAVESRFFVVDGEVVAGSRYVTEGTKDLGVPDAGALDYARRMVERWRPHDNFVIDVALTEGVHKIIEVNCINTSGLYACDPEPIFVGMSRYVDRISQNADLGMALQRTH